MVRDKDATQSRKAQVGKARRGGTRGRAAGADRQELPKKRDVTVRTARPDEGKPPRSGLVQQPDSVAPVRNTNGVRTTNGRPAQRQRPVCALPTACATPTAPTPVAPPWGLWPREGQDAPPSQRPDVPSGGATVPRPERRARAGLGRHRCRRPGAPRQSGLPTWARQFGPAPPAAHTGRANLPHPGLNACHPNRPLYAYP